MKIPAAFSNGVLIVAAAMLVAVLAFLYDKTQAVDLRERNETRGVLRQLKDIDTHWDNDVLRARVETSAAIVAAPERNADAMKALDKLDAAQRNHVSPALAAALPALKTAVAQKAALMQQFEINHRAELAALQTVRATVPMLGAHVNELHGHFLMLEQALRTVLAVAPQYYLTADDAQKSLLEVAASQLQFAQAPEDLHLAILSLGSAVQTLLTAKSQDQTLSAQLATTTAGARLESVAFAFDREIEAALDEKERYRAYLAAYAGALLVLIAWLGSKVRAANLGLERRVQERTLELSAALRHLKESETQLIQSEKMAALGQMVAGVAHEINTPLAYVKNSLGVVAGKLPDLGMAVSNCGKLMALLQAGANADRNELSQQFATASAQIAQIRQQGMLAELAGLVNDGLYGTGQMAEIIGNLKDFSRLDRSKVTSFNLNDGLDSTLLLAKHLLKGISVNKKFGSIPTITCSPSQINQVFLNLITNAAQAMEKGTGSITLTTRGDGNGVAIEVIDDGKGIAPEVLPKIFDPFFTTKEAGKGTGLGLSISYKIIQQHGGRINVESRPGAGTRFTIWLPLEATLDSMIE